MATDSIAISQNVTLTSFWQGAVVVLGRFLFALIFLMAGINQYLEQLNRYLVRLISHEGPFSTAS